MLMRLPTLGFLNVQAASRTKGGDGSFSRKMVRDGPPQLNNASEYLLQSLVC